ncbi:MAG: hypothetical protein IT581_01285 [Verrucomicrobiales bacterium]|nr:hypothetical protein [Verrucomicrobiales bacterium]
MIADWYKQRGYQFLALTEHNALAEGQRWLSLTNSRGGGPIFARYLERFGPDWVEQRTADGVLQVRLKPLSEFRTRLEERDRFLLIPAMEITDRHLTAPIHINAANITAVVPPQGGSNVLDVMQRNVNAVLEQRERTGQPMFPHINHPNFGWAITAEELMRVEGERFFEIYNGHPDVHNLGDDSHAGVERVWDLLLAFRIGVLGLPPMLGLAVDDSHHYLDFAVPKSNPGRGWVMVRAPLLTPESIIGALEAGDFYATTGVVLNDIRRDGKTFKIEIAAEHGVTYRTQFIGTRRGFDRANEPIRNAAGDRLRVTHRYSAEIGRVLAEVDGASAHFSLNDDELYVRAKVTSSKPKTNPNREGETEVAWTQPLLP